MQTEISKTHEEIFAEIDKLKQKILDTGVIAYVEIITNYEMEAFSNELRPSHAGSRS